MKWNLKVIFCPNSFFGYVYGCFGYMLVIDLSSYLSLKIIDHVSSGQRLDQNLISGLHYAALFRPAPNKDQVTYLQAKIVSLGEWYKVGFEGFVRRNLT
ncbi:hypothetical protein QVD17_40337 [Tagetes erecta]|uniref:Uncharacterized protein n=1 Tax=Tagetes erecta TaxID=13708 RepID=A0AAD8JRC9_TARER|nr:hypothetical protein QVD17_40337 [Tagetes erecta]